MYNAENAMEQSLQIAAVLREHFGSESKKSVGRAAHDLHDIAWECQNIVERVERIREGRLNSREAYRCIIDILVGLQSHINKTHLRSLKRFIDKLDLEEAEHPTVDVSRTFL